MCATLPFGVGNLRDRGHVLPSDEKLTTSVVAKGATPVVTCQRKKVEFDAFWNVLPPSGADTPFWSTPLWRVLACFGVFFGGSWGSATCDPFGCGPSFIKCPIMSHNVPSGGGDMGHGTWDIEPPAVSDHAHFQRALLGGADPLQREVVGFVVVADEVGPVEQLAHAFHAVAHLDALATLKLHETE